MSVRGRSAGPSVPCRTYHVCLARHDACAAAYGGVAFTDDDCVAYVLCTAQTTAKLDVCLAGTCDTIPSCIDDVLQW